MEKEVPIRRGQLAVRTGKGRIQFGSIVKSASVRYFADQTPEDKARQHSTYVEAHERAMKESLRNGLAILTSTVEGEQERVVSVYIDGDSLMSDGILQAMWP